MTTSMTDITALVCRYREAARHLWNSCFRDGDEGDAAESFDRICEELFNVLVLRPVGVGEQSSQLNVQGFQSIRVVPAIEEGTPVFINRTNPSGPYWDDPIAQVRPQAVELALIGFFDWDSCGFSEMRYLRVRIMSCRNDERLVGREALIDAAHARVVALTASRTVV